MVKIYEDLIDGQLGCKVYSTKLILGPFTLTRKWPKLQKIWLGFLLYRLHCQNLTHNIRGFNGTRLHAHCAKKPVNRDILQAVLRKWCASARQTHHDLMLDRTRVVRITSRAAVGWFRWMSRTTWPKISWIIPVRSSGATRMITLAKNQWNYRLWVSKTHAAEVGFLIRVFWSV